MATADDEGLSLTGDLTLCSICLEQYKLPVSLPCSHSFCQTCLSTHIIACCVNCDPQLGFPCPLCRKFIPAPGRFKEYSVDQWAKLFPENKLLASVATGTMSVYCRPCQEDGEESKASSWCMDCTEALCDDCVKYHKKFRANRSHVVVSLTECSSSFHQPLALDKCEAHDGRRIEILCKEHLVPCCSVCVIKEHVGCKRFCQIEDVDEEIVGLQHVKNLQTEVETMCSNLEKIIADEKMNMNCLDDASDAYAKELSEITTAIIDTVKKLEEKHLDEIAKITKESKSKLERSMQSIEHRLTYLQFWKEKLLENLAKETTLAANEVLSYIKMKQIYEIVRKLDFSKLEISIQTGILDSVRNLITLSSLAETTSREHLIKNPFAFDQRKLDLKCADVISIFEFKIDNCDITDGEFLSGDRLLLTDNRNKRCILCNTDGEVLKEISLPGKPWGLCFHEENEVLVTLPDNKEVVILDANSLEIKQVLSVNCHCRGIAMSGHTAVIGARSSVVMFPDISDRNICGTLTTERGTTDDVAIDVYGNVIYSNYSESSVKKLDKSGKILFHYSHEELKMPYGLTVDGHGNIFVNESASNNIHIVSNEGKIIRILQGVQDPKCIKFLRGTYRFLVGEAGGCVKVFELQES